MKRIILFIFSFLVSFSVFSQCDSVGHFDFAATAGMGVSKWRMSNQTYDKKPSYNYQFGVLVDYTVYENLFVESGLSYHHKGMKIKHEGYVEWEHLSYDLYYLHIPMNVAYKFPFEKVMIAPLLGPYMGIALGGSYVREGETIYNEVRVPYSSRQDLFKKRLDKYRRFDVGLRIGVEVMFNKRYRVGMGYDIGFVNVRKDLVMGEEVKSKNGVFSVTFAYYLTDHLLAMKKSIVEKRNKKRESAETLEELISKEGELPIEQEIKELKTDE